jgi:hypothetical protein
VQTLYQRVLGKRFAELHSVLRRFHSFANGGTATCRFQVLRHPGRMQTLLAKVLRLPPEQETVEARLDVVPTIAGERWQRSIGLSTFVTFQTSAGALLRERAGPMNFGIKVEVVDGGMVFRTVQVCCCGLPLPSWCAPSVQATIVPIADGWFVVVRLTLPYIGQLLQYQGEVYPQWT